MKGSLNQRNGVWYISTVVDGVRIRRSAKTRDRATAERILAGMRQRFEVQNVSQEWNSQVDAAADDPKSWISVLYRNMQKRTKDADRTYMLSEDELLLIIKRSGGRCELTGIQFSWSNLKKRLSAPFQPSIDRIDSSQGYEAGNCRIVCLAVNIAMREWGEQVLETIGMAVLRRRLDKELSLDHP